MKSENFEEYIDSFIEFYKEMRLCGYTTNDLRKLVVRNLQNIKRKYLKEKNAQNDTSKN